ncbi:MAG: sigma-70 family RNA polymerase sigma factor [Rhodospirillales bacterium]|nr:sigma-70 family RNA polymerase sigma factor [Rhodospirillales bacterium]
MGDKDRRSLLRHLVAGHDDLARRLSRRFGAVEAADALQDTFIRIGQAEALPPIKDPLAYLFRVAVNLATDHRRAHARQRLDAGEVSRLLEIPDKAPGPAAIVEGRLQIEALSEAIRQLPERRRAIFLAARVEELPHRIIADRFGISVRTVAYEIERALDHCATYLGR